MGKVYLVKSRKTNKLFAMKELKKSDMIKQNKIKRVLTEREILLTCEHPFIVSMYHCWHEGDSIYFIMEYSSYGDLFTLLQEKKRLPEYNVFWGAVHRGRSRHTC